MLRAMTFCKTNIRSRTVYANPVMATTNHELLTSSNEPRYNVPRPRNLYNFLVALFVACGSLCYGYASSISAALIGSPAWYDYFGLVAGSSHTNSILGAINGE